MYYNKTEDLLKLIKYEHLNLIKFQNN